MSLSCSSTALPHSAPRSPGSNVPEKATPLACLYCSVPFADWAGLFDHVVDCTPSAADVPATKATHSGNKASNRLSKLTSDSRTATCVSSSASNDMNSTVAKDEAGRHEPSERHQCTCGLSYSQPYNLQRHQRQKGCLKADAAGESADKQTKEAGRGPFFCPYPECGKEIRFESNYRSHIVFHQELELKWASIKSQATSTAAISQSSAAVGQVNGTDFSAGPTYVQVEIEL